MDVTEGAPAVALTQQQWFWLQKQYCEQYRFNNSSLSTLERKFKDGVRMIAQADDGGAIVCPETTCSDMRCASFFVVTCAMIAFTLYANVHVLYVVWGRIRASNGGSTINAIILHISIADLLVALCVMAPNAAHSLDTSWPLGGLACRTYKLMNTAVLYVSTFLTMLLALDRLLAIRWPLRDQLRRKTSKVSFYLIWSVGLLLSIPQMLVHEVTPETYPGSDDAQCLERTYNPTLRKAYNLAVLIVLTAVPFLFFLAVYSYIVYYLSTKIDRAQTSSGSQAPNNSAASATEQGKRLNISASSNQARSDLIGRAKRRALLMTTVIVLTFLVNWLPYNVMWVAVVVFHHQPNDTLYKVAILFGQSNALWNPLVYGLFNIRGSGGGGGTQRGASKLPTANCCASVRQPKRRPRDAALGPPSMLHPNSSRATIASKNPTTSRSSCV